MVVFHSFLYVYRRVYPLSTYSFPSNLAQDGLIGLAALKPRLAFLTNAMRVWEFFYGMCT